MRWPWQREPVVDVVPSQANIAQLDELAQRGLLSSDLAGLFSLSVGGTTVSYGYTPLLRCVSLCASIIAQLVTGGGLSIQLTRSTTRPPVNPYYGR